jgi:hypothetical protein
MNYSYANQAKADYNSILEISIQEGADIDSVLNEEFSIDKTEVGLFTTSSVIDNPLAYYNDQIKRAFFAASPQYTLAQMGEASFLIIFPLLFGMIGAFIGSYDLTQKTIKLKGVRFSRFSIGLAKHLCLFISALAVYIIALIIVKIMGVVMFQYLSRALGADGFAPLEQNGYLWLKLTFAYVIGFLFAEICLNVSMIFKRAVVGIVAVFLYLLLLPNLGRFDIKNAVHFLASKVYDFYGVVSVGDYTDATVMGSVIALIVVFVVFVGAGMITLKRRGLYE